MLSNAQCAKAGMLVIRRSAFSQSEGNEHIGSIMTFDHTDLELDFVKRKVEEFVGTALGFLWDAGKELKKAQGILASHNKGTFREWVTINFDFSIETAMIWHSCSAVNVFGQPLLSSSDKVASINFR